VGKTATHSKDDKQNTNYWHAEFNARSEEMAPARRKISNFYAPCAPRRA
jgi:hypothetical protein